MRFINTFPLALVLILSGAPADAAEKGAVIRAGELKAEPFVDAATSESIAANQPVSIVGRQGGWAQVETNGKTGWVRMLNIRMETGAGSGIATKPNANGKPGIGSLLRTGSSGKTVTTGVKGLDEEDIRNATMNQAEVVLLATLVVEPTEAIANAKNSGLKESSVEYLKGGSKK